MVVAMAEPQFSYEDILIYARCFSVIGPRLVTVHYSITYMENKHIINDMKFII